MATKSNKKAKAVPLKIGPSISIDSIAELKKNYTEIINAKNAVEIKAETIENIDLSGIQFLIWLKKNKTLEKSIETIEFNETALELVNKCGFTKHFKK